MALGSIIAVIGVFVIFLFGVWHDRRIDRHMEEMFRDDHRDDD